MPFIDSNSLLTVDQTFIVRASDLHAFINGQVDTNVSSLLLNDQNRTELLNGTANPTPAIVSQSAPSTNGMNSLISSVPRFPLPNASQYTPSTNRTNPHVMNTPRIVESLSPLNNQKSREPLTQISQSASRIIHHHTPSINRATSRVTTAMKMTENRETGSQDPEDLLLTLPPVENLNNIYDDGQKGIKRKLSSLYMKKIPIVPDDVPTIESTEVLTKDLGKLKPLSRKRHEVNKDILIKDFESLKHASQTTLNDANKTGLKRARGRPRKHNISNGKSGKDETPRAKSRKDETPRTGSRKDDRSRSDNTPKTRSRNDDTPSTRIMPERNGKVKTSPVKTNGYTSTTNIYRDQNGRLIRPSANTAIYRDKSEKLIKSSTNTVMFPSTKKNFVQDGRPRSRGRPRINGTPAQPRINGERAFTPVQKIHMEQSPPNPVDKPISEPIVNHMDTLIDKYIDIPTDKRIEIPIENFNNVDSLPQVEGIMLNSSFENKIYDLLKRAGSPPVKTGKSITKRNSKSSPLITYSDDEEDNDKSEGIHKLKINAKNSQPILRTSSWQFSDEE